MEANDYLAELEKEHKRYKVLSQKQEGIITAICQFDSTVEELVSLRKEHKNLTSELFNTLHKSSELIQKYFYAATAKTTSAS